MIGRPCFESMAPCIVASPRAFSHPGRGAAGCATLLAQLPTGAERPSDRCRLAPYLPFTSPGPGREAANVETQGDRMTAARPARAHLIAGGFPPGSSAGHDHDFARLRVLECLQELEIPASVANDF